MAAADYSITDATGATIQVAADPLRETVILQSDTTSDRIHLAWNGTAVYGTGLYLDGGATITLTGRHAKDPITMVCDTGLTATIYAEIG